MLAAIPAPEDVVEEADSRSAEARAAAASAAAAAAAAAAAVEARRCDWRSGRGDALGALKFFLLPPLVLLCAAGAAAPSLTGRGTGSLLSAETVEVNCGGCCCERCWCGAGEGQCRRMVRPNEYREAWFQQRYGDHCSPHIRNLIAQEKEAAEVEAKFQQQISELQQQVKQLQQQVSGQVQQQAELSHCSAADQVAGVPA